ncbi:hypothetical protein B0H10DRAFT_2217322 [Mycena sp. CBHHK59/15]|nr:hypothetical protein B0H10DRAFT_2217322 [Mycena sp. CBHHK59/15]
MSSDLEWDHMQHYAQPIPKTGFRTTVTTSTYRDLDTVCTAPTPPVSIHKGGGEEGLAAFGSGKTLNIPARISALEEKMSKAYGEANKGQDRPAKKGKTSAKLQESTELSGKFTVIAPYLTEQWEDQTGDMWLKLCPSSTSSHLWGAFDFGVVSGFMRSSTAIPTAVGDSVSFFWRGRESGEGESTFGENNVCTITFLGGGRFKAKMDWDMGDFDFAGKKLEGAQGKIVGPKSLRAWKSGWRGINQGAYDRESRARWGGWGGDEDEGEKPAGSDTTQGAESDVEGQEEGDYENCAF